MIGNVYWDPQNCGLSQVGILDEDNLSYEFNTLLVVRHDLSGRVFYCTSSGCSCPTPFEEYSFNGPDDNNLTEVKAGDSFAGFQREVEGFPVTQEEREALIETVKKLVTAR